MATNQSPDVLEQVPAGGNVSEPASGTYGEKAELERLRQELPVGEEGVGEPEPQVAPTPSAVAPSSSPAGLPPGLLRPTQRPDVPQSTPLQGGGPPDLFAGAADARQRRLRVLDILAEQAPSPEVREWATTLREALAASV